MSEIIHLYHTNDLHSHFENWPRIKDFLNQRCELHKEVGEEAITLDIGDHVDRWHPYTEGTLGKGNVTLLNEAGFQYVTIGNNEGITLPHEALDSLYKEADFKVLAANIFQSDRQRPAWALPYAIHTTEKGTRIGMIGLTAYFQSFYTALGWKLSDPFQELYKQLDILKEQSDIIVILSHLGLYEDERMAGEFPEIDIILGAHTHHILHQGKVVNNTLLCAGGKFGMYVGHVEIDLDDTRKVVRKEAALYDTNDLKELPNESEWIDSIYNKGREYLQQKCVVLPKDLDCEWFEASELPRILCEALREWSNADCAFLNAGLLLQGLQAGEVTIGDIHRILPHPINPCVVELNGSELKEILIQSLNQEWPHIQMKGFGFRGKIMGIIVHDRVDFIKGKNDVIQKVLVDGRELIAENRYKLALPDMFTFGHFFPQIQRSKDKQYLMPEFLRDVMVWKLRGMFS
ncbi:bifunctional metallophosphatase/5'-nucleotidase [Peribacillus cavernae]|uniref:Bifunctional metallophosphatase/5'-nucleotidase n=1 Tax=Peribacillus cavernae TaxID=1674310 RepID=A0A433HC78_9BACI|nr:bifunctional UDP-sugar hydrolase/5'-nucleotidase [Peribacillus cavernae]MDQ0219669.1 2',3'-cyclic-nucleotide 2'-phosphodiesterase (5'-nucleotidase family) [Peribacillus cavernae]RUQ25949.1 bifunctional metallophosphatase/5'-nucleotidase [Peribacillus cavernae]